MTEFETPLDPKHACSVAASWVTVVDTTTDTIIETTTTELGAHTLGWDPTHVALYVFCLESSGAAIYEDAD